MKKRASLILVVLAATIVAHVALAGTEDPWDGLYAGINAGTSRNSPCTGGALRGVVLDPTSAAAFENPSCSGGSAFVGEKVKVSRLALNGAAPAGTYAFSGRFSPARLVFIAPRIGYASLQWLAYAKAGAVLAGGSHESTLSYIAPGAKIPTVGFSGGNTFAATGWVAGRGIEYGFNGPWSISAEYLHMSLGKGSDSSASCGGSAAACAPFAGVTFNSVHDGFTANVIRIGVNYWFGYWGQ